MNVWEIFYLLRFVNYIGMYMYKLILIIDFR